MLENFILYFYLLKQTCLYFLYIFLFEHSNKKKIQTDGKKKKKIIGSRLLGFFRRCEKKPLAHFQRSCPK
jgi:hypothetical protein